MISNLNITSASALAPTVQSIAGCHALSTFPNSSQTASTSLRKQIYTDPELFEKYQAFLKDHQIDQTCRDAKAERIFKLLEANGFVKHLHNRKTNTTSIQVKLPLTLPETASSNTPAIIQHPSIWQKTSNFISGLISLDTRTFNSKAELLSALDETYTGNHPLK